MFLVTKQINGQWMFLRSRKSVLYWVLDPNNATTCWRESTADYLATQFEAEIIEASAAACYVSDIA